MTEDIAEIASSLGVALDRAMLTKLNEIIRTANSNKDDLLSMSELYGGSVEMDIDPSDFIETLITTDPTQRSYDAEIRDLEVALVTDLYGSKVEEGEGIFGTLQVTDIDNPSAELNARVGTVGDTVLCYEVEANVDQWTLYVFDAASGIAEAVPYTIDASGSGFWTALAGKYIQQETRFVGLLYAPNLGGGVDDSVVVLDSDGSLRTDEIDTRVWGSTLVDTDGSGTNNELATWSGVDTIVGEANLTFSGTHLDVNATATIGGTGANKTLSVKGSGVGLPRAVMDATDKVSNPGFDFRHNADDNIRAVVRSSVVSSTGANLEFFVSPTGSGPANYMTLSIVGILSLPQVYGHNMNGETFRTLLINDSGELGVDTGP